MKFEETIWSYIIVIEQTTTFLEAYDDARSEQNDPYGALMNN